MLLVMQLQPRHLCLCHLVLAQLIPVLCGGRVNLCNVQNEVEDVRGTTADS